MNIYIAELNNLVKHSDLSDFDHSKKYKDELKKQQHMTGRFLTKYIAKKVFNVKNSEISVKNKKPYFAESDLKFNISHSQDYVAVCFDEEDLGFDIEYMRERDFEKLMARYKIPAQNHKNIFYRFWCEYEAKLKLQKPEKSLITFQIFDEYMSALAFASQKDIENELKIYKLDTSLNMEEIKPVAFFEPINVKI